jgi:hypothetical protein
VREDPEPLGVLAGHRAIALAREFG